MKSQKPVIRGPRLPRHPVLASVRGMVQDTAMPGRPRRKSQVTIQQVADRVGVSVQTVSAILGTKSHLYRDETQRAVRATADELGYRPNALAKATRTGRSGNIALLIANDLTVSQLSAGLIEGIEHVISERSLRLLLTQLPDDKLTDEGYVPNVLREWFADGLLINYHYRIPPRMVELIRRNELPSIWINSRQEADCVYPDEHGAARQLTQWFIEEGHRRIAYVDFVHGSDVDREHYSVTDRRNGYETCMREAGLSPMWRTFNEKVPSLDRPGIARELLEVESPTAIIAYNDTSANAIGVACHMTGRRLRDDLWIGTFGPRSIRICSINHAVTMIVPDREMGTIAMRLLLKRIEEPNRHLAPEVIPFQLDCGGFLGV